MYMCVCAFVIYHKLQNKNTSEEWRNAENTGNRIDRNSGAVFFKARFWGDILATGAYLFGIRPIIVHGVKPLNLIESI